MKHLLLLLSSLTIIGLLSMGSSNKDDSVPLTTLEPQRTLFSDMHDPAQLIRTDGQLAIFAVVLSDPPMSLEVAV